MIEQLYFCTECKKNIGPTNDILFVQEKNAKGFCSEHCIDQHYGNIRQAVQLIEYEKRAELGLDSKEGLKVLRPDEHKSQLLFSPMEIWKTANALGENFYIHISRFVSTEDEAYFGLACLSYVNQVPSYVYHYFFSRSIKLLDCFRLGEKIKAYGEQTKMSDTGTQIERELEAHEWPDEETSGFNNEEVLADELELKRSSYLAELIELRDENDIGFHEFPKYDKYLESTLQAPDEVFHFQDKDGEKMASYIKSYEENEISFYYVAICWQSSSPINGEYLFLPVISFPSTDQKLYSKYSQGKKQDQKPKN